MPAESALLGSKPHRPENPLYERMGVPFQAPAQEEVFRISVPRVQGMSEEQHAAVCTQEPRYGHIMVWHDLGHAPGAVDGRVYGCETMKEEKAKQLVDYANCLYRNQPAWLKARYPLKNESAHELEWVAGGRIMGVPQGPASDSNLQAHHLHHGRSCLPGRSRAVLLSRQGFLKLRANHRHQFRLAGMVWYRMYYISHSGYCSPKGSGPVEYPVAKAGVDSPATTPRM